MTPRVLFISHDATRTGAPFGLLHLIQWMRRSGALTPSVLLGGGGPLVDDFRAVSPTVVAPAELRTVRRMLKRVEADALAATVRRSRLSRAVREVADVDLVYSNTLANGSLLPAVAGGGRPVISHAHELREFVDRAIPARDLDATKALTDHYVVPSRAVWDLLVEDHDVAPERIDQVREWVGVAPGTTPPTADERGAWRHALGLPRDAFVVGAAGTLDWRKGCDLFVHLAAAVGRMAPGQPIHFCWVGGGTRADVARLRHDIDLSGCASAVTLTGVRTDTPACFAAFDVFALTSREDAYPLVMLENGLRGNPTVCFAGSGGAPEFVAPDAGLVVPYLDVHAMAETILGLRDDRAALAERGAAAFDKVVADHDVEVAGPRLVEVMERALAA